MKVFELENLWAEKREVKREDPNFLLSLIAEEDSRILPLSLDFLSLDFALIVDSQTSLWIHSISLLINFFFLSFLFFKMDTEGQATCLPI